MKKTNILQGVSLKIGIVIFILSASFFTSFANPIVLTPLADPCNTEGEQVNLPLIATGGDGALFYSASNLPPGITIHASSGLISGTVDASAFTGTPYIVNISVDDSDGDFGDIQYQTLTWTIHDSPVVLYRINAGGPQITAIDAAIDWGADTKSSPSSFLVSAGSNSASSHGGMNSYDASVDLTTTPTSIYTTERWDIVGGSQIEYGFPLSAGVYELRLYLGNEDASSSTPGTRVFDISVEGTIPSFLKDIDMSSEFGHRVGGVFSYSLIVNDGAMNIKFFHNIKNPIINGIEIITGDSCNLPSAYPITLTPFPDQFNEEGQRINLKVLASGGDGNLVYSATNLPAGLNLNSSSGIISGTINNTAATNSPYAVTFTVDDSNVGDVNTETTSFTWEVFPSGTPVIDAWTLLEPQISPKHTGRHENSFVKAGSNFYLMGGRESPKKVEVYDYVNRSWSIASAEAPKELNHFQPIYHGGYIWVLGAFENNNFPNEDPADSIYLYDPFEDVWTTGREIPVARRRGSAGAVVYGDKIYLVGGNTIGHNGGYVKWFDEYDPATGTWTPLADAPRERDHFQAVLIGDKLYLAAGRLSGGPGGTHAPMIGEVDVYNFATNSWSTLGPGSNIPTLRAGAAAVNFNDNLFVIGGEGNGQAWTTVESMNPATNTWQSRSSLNIARHGTQAVVAGGGIYISSGSPLQANGNMTNMELYSKENAPGETDLVPGQLLSPKSSLNIPPTSIGNSSTGFAKIYNAGGTQDLLVTKIDLQADPTEYELQLNFTLPIIIGIDDTVEFGVTYTPQTANPISGTVLVSHNGSNVPLSLHFTGGTFPVNWLSFTVEEQQGSAFLDWSTGSELNNQHFVVERSLDSNSFESIGIVKGVGNSSRVSSYKYVDKEIYGMNVSSLTYRLKQVDFDGGFTYSKQVELNIDLNNGFPLRGYPVPFDKELYVRYDPDRFDSASLRVLNTLGQIIIHQEKLDESGTLKLDTHTWLKGIYFIQIKGNRVNQVFKVRK